MSNRTDIVVETDNAEGQVLLSASRVYDLTEDKTQDTINGEVKNTLNQKAAKVDLTNISQSRPNCTVTNGIAKGTYFYLDGILTRATASISKNAPFTSSNCETITAGGLNELNNKISYVDSAQITITAAANSNVLAEVTVTIPSGYTAIGFSVFQESLSGSWNVQLTYLAKYKRVSFFNCGTSENTWTGFVRFILIKN